MRKRMLADSNAVLLPRWFLCILVRMCPLPSLTPPSLNHGRFSIFSCACARSHASLNRLPSFPQELVSLHEGMRNRVTDDDKALPAEKNGSLLKA